ncbi:hypothetical protein E2320_023036 [Naja naja]|nr:hypothetical protein E2320_023036 [Naja naja]
MEFHRWSQNEGESINDYIATLQRTAMYCEFRDLEDLPLDRLICGVRDVSLQRRLLAKPNLTLKIALDETRATKTSIKAMATIQKDKSPNNTHRGNTA